MHLILLFLECLCSWLFFFLLYITTVILISKHPLLMISTLCHVCCNTFLSWLFTCLFVYGCPGSSLPWVYFSCGAWTSYCSGLSCCRAGALECRLSSCGAVAPRHVGSSSLTKDWTCVPCIGRWILNHWTTRKVPVYDFWYIGFYIFMKFSIFFPLIGAILSFLLFRMAVSLLISVYLVSRLDWSSLSKGSVSKVVLLRSTLCPISL